MTSAQAKAAHIYYKNSLLQKDHGEKLLNMVDVSPGSFVLDLGCGTGHLATVLSEMVGPEGKVVAVDPDAERIKIAKEKNARPNINYLVADDQSFPGDGHTLIVATHVIHWIENKEALFDRIYHKLAVGGKFAFVTYNGTPAFPPTSSMAFRDLISPDFEQNILFNKMVFATNSEYHHLATQAGLKVTIEDNLIHPQQWASVDEFLTYWAGVCQGDFQVTSIDQKSLQDFKKQHKKNFVSEVLKLGSLFVVLTKVANDK